MVAPGSIRAGAAYVEITADDGPMFQRLRQTQSRLRAWVAQQNAQPLTKGTEAAVLGQGREGGFLGGGFRGMEFAETGLRFVTAIQAARVALTDVKMLSAAVRGDWEGMRKVAEDLPFGLGQVTKELGAMADAAGRWLVEWAHPKSLYDKLGEEARAKELRESVRIHNERLRGEKAILDARHAYMRATMDARSLARAEVAEMALPADQAEHLLSLKLAQIEAEERRRAAIRAVGEEQARIDRETEAGWRRAEEAERAKAALVQRQATAYRAMQDALADVQRRALESRAGLDAIAREEAGALRELAEKAVEAGMALPAFAQQADRVKAAFADLRKAEEEAGLKAEGKALTESLRTPEERARSEVARYGELRAAGAIDAGTYGRAVKRSLEEAAAVLPDVVQRTVGVRGTFSALEAGRLGAGGASDRIASATEKTAKNTEKIARLAENLGVTFQ